MSLLSDLGTKVGAEFKSHRLRIEAVETNLDSKAAKATTLSGYGITDAQGTLVSGTNIKTLNGISLLGSGDIVISSTDQLATSRSIALTGDVSGSVSFDGSQDVVMTVTINQNSVALGSDTVGDYVSTISTAPEISITNTTSEGNNVLIGITDIGTAGTYSKVTTNSKGQVISGTNITSTDIPNLDASKITSGTIDAARLPSFVDDVLEYNNSSLFPATGETGKIYIALDNNKTYRWSGSTYIVITSGAVDSVAGKTGIVTLTKSDVGLSNVDNTSDVNKPISTATQNALNSKQNSLVSGTSIKTINSASILGSGDITIDKSSLGLSNVENTTDITKNVLSATKLTTPRTINGVSFDGTSNINISSSTINSQIIKFDAGTTEGTDLYTFNGVSSKIIDIQAGTNISLTKNAGAIVINANVIGGTTSWNTIVNKPTTLSGYGITDAQTPLTSGANIKTINNQSILGSGNLSIAGSVVSVNGIIGDIDLNKNNVIMNALTPITNTKNIRSLAILPGIYSQYGIIATLYTDNTMDISGTSVSIPFSTSALTKCKVYETYSGSQEKLIIVSGTNKIALYDSNYSVTELIIDPSTFGVSGYMSDNYVLANLSLQTMNLSLIYTVGSTLCITEISNMGSLSIGSTNTIQLPNLSTSWYPCMVMGKYLYIGDPQGNTNKGQVHIYQPDAYGNLTFLKTINNPLSNKSQFGNYMTISNDSKYLYVLTQTGAILKYTYDGIFIKSQNLPFTFNIYPSPASMTYTNEHYIYINSTDGSIIVDYDLNIIYSGITTVDRQFSIMSRGIIYKISGMVVTPYECTIQLPNTGVESKKIIKNPNGDTYQLAISSNGTLYSGKTQICEPLVYHISGNSYITLNEVTNDFNGNISHTEYTTDGIQNCQGTSSAELDKLVSKIIYVTLYISHIGLNSLNMSKSNASTEMFKSFKTTITSYVETNPGYFDIVMSVPQEVVDYAATKREIYGIADASLMNVVSIFNGIRLATPENVYSSYKVGDTLKPTTPIYNGSSGGSISSVNGLTGTVVLSKSDIGLPNVDNTSDLVKQVLSATKLTTPRTINGVSFDGTTNINLPSLPSSTVYPLTIKFDTGTTQGTDLYTFDGLSTKTIDFKAGTNITLTKTAGSVVINSTVTSIGIGSVTGLGTGISTFLGTPSSANLLASITDETGTGSLVFATSPTLVTPNIGVATGTSFNSITGLSTTTPNMNSTAAVGVSTTVARADHIHPSDTTKQNTLVSGTTIKTINGTTLLGSGDITISGGATLSDDTTTVATYYPIFATATTGSMLAARVSSTKLNYNPSTGVLSSTEFNALSDRTLKENINTIGNSLDIISKLNAVSFNWKDTGKKSYGVIAQELEEVLPELVNTNDEGIKSVNYDGLIGILLSAIQELSKNRG